MSGSGFILLHTAYVLISDNFSPKHLDTVHLIKMFPPAYWNPFISSIRTKNDFYDHWFCNKPTTSSRSNESSPSPGRADKIKTGSSTVLQQNGTEEMLSRVLVCQLHKPWIISGNKLELHRFNGATLKSNEQVCAFIWMQRSN